MFLTLIDIATLIIGVLGGVILAAVGIIGPLVLPLLLILGYSPDIGRGTMLASELLVTAISVVGHKRLGNVDRRIVAAYIPGALTVVIGARVSVEVPVSEMRVAIGFFEALMGVLIIVTTVRNVPQYKRMDKGFSKGLMQRLIAIGMIAGFAKGFFGAGWGPIGIGLFVLLGLDPILVVGSSLAIRLLLDCSGSLTYISMNLVDLKALLLLGVPGACSALIGVMVANKISRETLRMVVGIVVVILGVILITQTLAFAVLT